MHNRRGEGVEKGKAWLVMGSCETGAEGAQKERVLCNSNNSAFARTYSHRHARTRPHTGHLRDDKATHSWPGETFCAGASCLSVAFSSSRALCLRCRSQKPYSASSTLLSIETGEGDDLYVSKVFQKLGAKLVSSLSPDDQRQTVCQAEAGARLWIKDCASLSRADSLTFCAPFLSRPHVQRCHS